MAKTIRLVLGDQLTPTLPSLRDLDPASDIVVMAELPDEAGYVRHHKRKIAFLLAAMRHFADDLTADGIPVCYHRYGEHPFCSFTELIAQMVSQEQADRLILTAPGEWRVMQMMQDWRETLPCTVEIRDDDRFVATRDDFDTWAGDGRRTLRMEFFYREMRRKTGYLMNGDDPAGGAWNFDSDNRKPLPDDLPIPQRPGFPPDEMTAEVIALVDREFPHHFGDLDGFNYPVTRTQAAQALNWWIANALPWFGDYQDAMKTGEPLLFHSNISALINCGLLTARQACEVALLAWRDGNAPLNAVEGFIRQIIGWREYVRGLYWLKMPDYGDLNHLCATRNLPEFFWTANTKMNCLAQSIGETKANAYAHHIQRLMVIGNFSLLAGLAPKQVQEWYLAVYHDAYEWVEMPNVVGMILYADGGLMASKPYVASGAYIDRMSDYCKGCAYSVKAKNGEKACPFNYLYWDFLGRNAGKLEGNPRMAMPYKTLARMSPDKRQTIRDDAARFFRLLDDCEI
jgi:deoxyribodipyrimidine photolyase-related protein